MHNSSLKRISSLANYDERRIYNNSNNPKKKTRKIFFFFHVFFFSLPLSPNTFLLLFYTLILHRLSEFGYIQPFKPFTAVSPLRRATAFQSVNNLLYLIQCAENTIFFSIILHFFFSLLLSIFIGQKGAKIARE